MLFYTVYSWATCTHQIMLDARGLRVDPTTIPANSIVTNAYPPHVCLDCAALNTALIEARVQPALPQPMVNTGSNSKVLALARQPPPPRQSPAQHTTRQACRTHNPNCHSHHGMSLACHKPWQQCYHAQRAAGASFHAKSKWTGAPAGWHEAHEACLRAENPRHCDFHRKLYLEALPVAERAGTMR
ncbi:hypothetical protein BDV97DRAFT_407463 [Delphinella strobiligena]|nr:hypothetical protein BDV97DRAFT_407463 [Delphinella strobiligena]